MQVPENSNEYEEALKSVRAEAMATQFVLIGLLHGLRQLGPNGHKAIEAAFGYADLMCELSSSNIAGPEMANYHRKLSEIVDQIRAATISETGPKRDL